MAEDTANDLTWLLEIAHIHRDHLGQIRHWPDLKAARDGDSWWIKGATQTQLRSTAIKTIPFKTIYYLKENKLFPEGHLVPVKKLPAGLLWTPIERVLPIQLPSFNHNYFGIQQQLRTRIVQAVTERSPFALLTPLNRLKTYIETAPEIRLVKLTWIILDEEQALIIGTPLLPIPGATYWQNNSFLLPTGYDLELNSLATLLHEQINPDDRYCVLWHKDATFTLIARELFKPLSISSFRQSVARSGA